MITWSKEEIMDFCANHECENCKLRSVVGGCSCEKINSSEQNLEIFEIIFAHFAGIK